MTPRLTVVDIGLSNTRSVVNAFRYLGVDPEVTSDPRSVLSADVIVLPGVGAYRQAMERLWASGLAEAVTSNVMGRGRKILGICLGMQILGRSGLEDGLTPGLSIIQTDVGPFTKEEVAGRKIPHVGFNSVRPNHESLLFRGLPAEPDFYFVHSFHMRQADLDGRTSLTNYGVDFVAAYENGNVFATQFHPEKSHANGLRLLKNFLEA